MKMAYVIGKENFDKFEKLILFYNFHVR